MQGRDIGEADNELVGLFDLERIDARQNPGSTVATPGTKDGVDGWVGNGSIQFVEPSLIIAGKVTFSRKNLRRMGDVVTSPKP